MTTELKIGDVVIWNKYNKYRNIYENSMGLSCVIIALDPIKIVVDYNSTVLTFKGCTSENFTIVSSINKEELEKCVKFGEEFLEKERLFNLRPSSSAILSLKHLAGLSQLTNNSNSFKPARNKVRNKCNGVRELEEFLKNK